MRYDRIPTVVVFLFGLDPPEAFQEQELAAAVDAILADLPADWRGVRAAGMAPAQLG